jgi:uncharacterized protein
VRRRALLFALALPWTVLAQAPRDSVVSVAASRVTRIAADRASLYLIVEGTAETATDAIARVETKSKAVLEALKGFGPRVKVDPPVSYGVGPTPNTNSFPGAIAPQTNIARSVVRVQLDRLDQVASVVAAAIGAGAATSSSLTFESSVADSIRRSRISEVIGAARLDAETVAASLGAKLGSLVSVTITGNPFGFQGTPSLTFDTRFGQQNQVPDVQVTTSATVQFRLVR